MLMGLWTLQLLVIEYYAINFLTTENFFELDLFLSIPFYITTKKNVTWKVFLQEIRLKALLNIN